MIVPGNASQDISLSLNPILNTDYISFIKNLYKTPALFIHVTAQTNSNQRIEFYGKVASVTIWKYFQHSWQNKPNFGSRPWTLPVT